MCSAGYGSLEVWGLIPNGDVTSKKRGFDRFTDTLFPSKSCCFKKKTNHVYPYGISQYPIIVPPQYPVKIMFPYFTHRQWSLNPDLQDTKPIRIAFALGNLAPQRANWFTGHGMLRKGWKMQKKNMVNRADLGSAVPTLLELRHRHGHHLASDNICRRHCPQSTPCS